MIILNTTKGIFIEICNDFPSFRFFYQNNDEKTFIKCLLKYNSKVKTFTEMFPTKNYIKIHANVENICILKEIIDKSAYEPFVEYCFNEMTDKILIEAKNPRLLHELKCLLKYRLWACPKQCHNNCLSFDYNNCLSCFNEKVKFDLFY